MYTFLDKGDRSITLRPEGTAGVVRSFLEHGLYNEPMPQKLCYLTFASPPVLRKVTSQNSRRRKKQKIS